MRKKLLKLSLMVLCSAIIFTSFNLKVARGQAVNSQIERLVAQFPVIETRNTIVRCSGLQESGDRVGLNIFGDRGSSFRDLFRWGIFGNFINDKETSLMIFPIINGKLGPLYADPAYYYISIVTTAQSPTGNTGIKTIFDKQVDKTTEAGYWPTIVNGKNLVIGGEYYYLKKEAASDLRRYCSELNQNIPKFAQLVFNLETLKKNLESLKNTLQGDFKVKATNENDPVAAGKIKSFISGLEAGVVKPFLQYPSMLITFDNVGGVAKEISNINGSVGRTKQNIDTYIQTGNIGALDNAIAEVKDAGAANDRLGSITFTITPGEIKLELEQKPIAVFPPGIFGKPATQQGYRQIDPQTFINIIIGTPQRPGFLLRLSEELFILWVIIGGIIYILSPFRSGDVSLAHGWIINAIRGYVIILLALAIISLLKGIAGF